MNHKTKLSAIVLATIPIAGCADLAVYKTVDLTRPNVSNALYYSLPRTSVNMIGTVTLTVCEDIGNGDKITPNMKVDGAVVPAVISEPDPNNRYYVSIKESNGFLKEVNYTVTNAASGALGSFNGTINDQAGPDAVAALQTAASIYGVVTLGAVAAPASVPTVVQSASKLVSLTPKGDAPKSTPSKYCKKDVVDALDLIAKNKSDIKDYQAKLKLLDTNNPAQAKEIAELNIQIQNAQSAISDAQKSGKLVHAFSYKWVPPLTGLDTSRSGYVLIKQSIDMTAIIESWLTQEGAKWLEMTENATPIQSNLRYPLIAFLAIDRTSIDPALISTPPDSGTTPSSTDKGALSTPPDSKMGGLIVEDAASGTLVVCKSVETGCTSTFSGTAENQVVDTTNDLAPRLAVKLPQFGRKLVLPEHSALFQNANLTVTLNADGTIQTIGYHSVSTADSGISGVGVAASTISTGIAARNTAIAADNTAAAALTTANVTKIQLPDTYNKALADCLTSQATIVKAGGTAQPCQ